jgi:Double zinc ribbon
LGDLLNFNPNRKLAFDVGRPLQFDSRRRLGFDPKRELGFAPNRNLGFGRRGVVFRGFVCPICGALVTEDAIRCGECGAVFESSPRASGPSTPPREKPAPKPKVRPATPPTVLPKAAFCAFCGVELKATDMFCWNCGTQRVDSAEVTRLPARKPVARERRESRRR